MQTQRAVRDTRRQELDRLEENFRTFIQPHLHGDKEDYDLVWGWEKFLSDKKERFGESAET